MAKELDNANPIILSAAELPTRRSKRNSPDALSSKGGGIREMLMEKPSYMLDPFFISEVSDDADSDDSTMEPIDEQEIYGGLKIPCPVLLPLSILLFLKRSP
jgi:hypothetical protein